MHGVHVQVGRGRVMWTGSFEALQMRWMMRMSNLQGSGEGWNLCSVPDDLFSHFGNLSRHMSTEHALVNAF